MANIHTPGSPEPRRDHTYREPVYHEPLPRDTAYVGKRGNPSAVSWGAIFAGAAGAAALSMILLLLGTGLGLSAVSPWSNEGITATTFGVTTIAWITFTQLAASGVGGYLAGRLRAKWVDAHRDEVYFRDTAHGFLAWAVSTLAAASMLSSAIGTVAQGGMQAGASVASGIANTALVATNAATASAQDENGVVNYFLDSLFRQEPSLPNSIEEVDVEGAVRSMTTPTANGPAPVAEVGRIFMRAISSDALPPQDVRYVGHLIARHTGISQQEAEKRVVDTYTRAKTTINDAKVATQEAADTARKAAAYGVLWLFVSLLIGAFAASLAATYGGRRRDA